MLIICECCNSPIERLTDVKLTHRSGCGLEAGQKLEKAINPSKSGIASKSDIADTQIQILPDGRMDVINAALYIGCHRGTLDNWRVLGQGPKFHKVAKKIYYKKAELDSWITSRESRTTAQARLAKLMNSI